MCEVYGIQRINMNSFSGVQNAQLGVVNTSVSNKSGVIPAMFPASSPEDTFVKTQATTAGINPSVSRLNSVLAAYAPRMYLDKYINQKTILKAINDNPEIIKILSEKNLSPNINMENVTGKNQEHFITTYAAANKLSQNLPSSEKNVLMQSALVHDIGKSLIPAEILNKKGKLTKQEKEIVDLHSRLGEEILKTTDVDKRVARCVGLHHTPCVSPQKANSQAAQILSVADVYSALKEERPYKKPFTDAQVKEIMTNDKNLNQNMVSTMLAA